MCFQGVLEPGEHHQMAQSIESKLQELHQRISSSSIYYLILIWFLRIVAFILSLGMWFIIWFLRLSFLLLREGIRRYVSTVAAIGLTLLQQPSHHEDRNIKVPEKEESAARSLDWAEPEEKASSPLLPVVVKDRVRICEENLAIQDRSAWVFRSRTIILLSMQFTVEGCSRRRFWFRRRIHKGDDIKIIFKESQELVFWERLLYEFDKIVAPQVSAFQLGEIVVPINDTRQLATFLKSKLTQTCKSQSSEDINAAICGSILNIRSKGAISKCVESWERAGSIKHAVVYIAAVLRGDDNIHLVLVGRKVEDFLGSNEFRTRFNPPQTRRDKQEWQTWAIAHLCSLKESAVDTAETLLSLDPVYAQVW